MTNNTEEIPKDVPWELENAEDLERVHLDWLDKLLAMTMLAGAFFTLGLFML